MTKIIYTRPDGGVSVVSPAPAFMAKFGSEELALAALRAKVVPSDATDVIEVDEGSIPTDREFRDAWNHAGGVFGMDMPKARAIQEQRIDRAKRNVAHDIIEREILGENVAGDKAALQAINVKSAIDNAADIAALKAAWPPGLAR